MGNGSSKKSSNKSKGSTGKKKQLPTVDNGPQVVTAHPQEPAGHVITNREIQDAISRGNVFSALVYCCCFLHAHTV